MREKLANDGIRIGTGRDATTDTESGKKLLLEVLEHYPPLIDLFTVLQEEKGNTVPEAEAFRAHSVLLDSSLRGDMGQYSILGWRPYLRVTQEGAFLNITEYRDSKDKVEGLSRQTVQKDFCDWLSDWMPTHFMENWTELPMLAGGIGYLSYDYGMHLMGLESENPKQNEIADVVFDFFSNLLIEDHRKQRLYLIANAWGQEAKDGMQAMQTLVAQAAEQTGGNTILQGQDMVRTDGRVMTDRKAAWAASDFTKEEYVDALLDMIRCIEEGDIYVANMTRQLTVKTKGGQATDPYAFFLKLRESNPSPFGGYADYGTYQIIAASPERFLQMRNNKIITRPIKGTRPRGSSPKEDAANRKELEDSEKDKSELLMIVDLERNDLNRVCVPGSVAVTELFALETYATVFHLVSTVVGELSPECGVWDLIRASFPGGSVTGAPKLSAMQIIDRLEHSRRQLYTGSMGYISLNGDCDFNIVIRTALHQKGQYTIGAGGGITWESLPDDEYDETTQKAAALLKALGVSVE